jgi:hypothetical protein
VPNTLHYGLGQPLIFQNLCNGSRNLPLDHRNQRILSQKRAARSKITALRREFCELVSVQPGSADANVCSQRAHPRI